MTTKVRYLYIHFPFCRHLCNYCDFFKKVSTSSTEVESYQHFLEDSWGKLDKIHDDLGLSMRNLETLYIGGGTPSLWGQAGALFLRDLFKKKEIELTAQTEFTLEVNPGAWTDESLNAFQEIGVNRISLGLQSLDEKYLRRLDRVHSLDESRASLKKLRELGINYSVDLMLGLPRVDGHERDIIKELQEILLYNPKHFSLYILTVKENYTHYASLPLDDKVADEYLVVSEFLKEKGFLHYEVSNFALPGYESRHNKKYWEHETVAALGPSATGFIKEKALRYKWKTKVADVELENLSEDSISLESVFLNLRTSTGIARAGNSRETEELFKSWNARGLLERYDDMIALNSRGFLVMDSLMDELMSSHEAQ